MEKNLPKHIALIMDGNRRWAKERNLDIKQGHYAGAENLEKIALYANKIGIKCPYTMSPEYITVHNTANDASAMSEISYMLGNDRECSFHLAVDDTRAVQGIDLNRNTWHAGDGGNGTGNRKSISIEICYSKSGGDRFIKAEQN